MAHFFLPSIIGFISPSCTIFEPMISAPALPKTMESSAPILMMALLMTVVSSSVLALSSSLAADYGSLAMSMSFSIMLSIGSTSRALISLVKSCRRRTRTRQTKRVLAREKAASIWFI